MNTNKHMENDGERERQKSANEEGHHVELPLLNELGLTVYVPSVSELRAKSDIIQPFRGRSLGKEFGFRCTADVGTALMRLIESFGLPNAPEYHAWSQDFMDFMRERALWAFIFQVNETQYFFVSHSGEELTIGCKGNAEMKTFAAFCRFIEHTVNRWTDNTSYN